MEALLKKKEDLTELSSCSSSNESSSGNLVDKVKKVNKAGSGRSKNSNVSNGNGDESKISNEDDEFKNLGSTIHEIDMMKQRFAKLLLGEDMSGSGKGVCTALAISNAITNLSNILGQLWRLEPIPEVKKSMWKREMEWLICVSDHIVELIPSWQNFPDGTKLEVMTCRPRSDIFINLPALRKLDNMLLDILDGFTNTEFWYVDQGIIAPDAADSSGSFPKTLPRRQCQEDEKWWLPVPRVPASGLSDNSRKQLNRTRDCTNQILKAATAINSISLAEMEVPDLYLDTLPKNGRACLGDLIYRYITTSDQFSADCLLDFLDLSSEHVALEIANRVEASIYVWRHRRSHSKTPTNANRPTAKSSWGIVKGLVVEREKREFLAERAENLLLCLKQRFPGLTQTALDTCKINCNKDIGNSIVESYSRVLESLAYNIVARIDDLLYVDDLTKNSELVPIVSIMYPVPVSCSPYKAASFSPALAPRISPASGDRAPFPKEKNRKTNNSSKPQRHGFGVKRVLTNYLGIDSEAKIRNPTPSIMNSNNNKSSENQKVQITSKQSSPYKNGIRMWQNHPMSCRLRLF